MQNESTALWGPENSSIHNTKHHNTRIQRERVASVVITVSHNQYKKSHRFTEKRFAPISDLNTKKPKTIIKMKPLKRIELKSNVFDSKAKHFQKSQPFKLANVI